MLGPAAPVLGLGVPIPAAVVAVGAHRTVFAPPRPVVVLARSRAGVRVPDGPDGGEAALEHLADLRAEDAICDLGEEPMLHRPDFRRTATADRLHLDVRGLELVAGAVAVAARRAGGEAAIQVEGEVGGGPRGAGHSAVTGGAFPDILLPRQALQRKRHRAQTANTVATRKCVSW